MQYFGIKNWDKFQHYKDRNPPWIKLHKEILDDYEMSRLQDASKLHLILLWVLASQLNNRIPYDNEWVKNKLSVHSAVDLKGLIDKDYLVLEQNASAMLASCTPETETETEKKNIIKEKFLLPDWLIPFKKDWNDYLDMRKNKKIPTTDRAKILLINALEKLRIEGQDCNQVIEAAIINGWKSFYPIKQDYSQNSSDKKPYWGG